jgi:2,4-dienoyl-CoA reductase-like NADH-dependent reductase (Old Yellow Enzyme family)/thioredoxin reductase
MPQIDRRTLIIGSAAAGTLVAAGLGTAGVIEASGDTEQKGAFAPAIARSSEFFPHLFTPIEIGGVHLKNRVVHACMGTAYKYDTEMFANYHANRARGGAAMIVMAPLDEGALGSEVLRQVADIVEGHDCRLIGQISHLGKGRVAPGRSLIAFGASALPDGISWTVPHVLTTADVKQMIEGFARRSRLLKEAGFRGVEICACHGHLIHEFLSAVSNQREDEYGGDLKGRARFLTDLMSAIRSSCGRPFIIGVKLVADDGMPGGIDPTQSKAITQMLHAAGEMDYLTFGWGSFSDTLYMHLPDRHGPRIPYLQQIRDIAKAAPGVPVGAIGLITEPSEGENIIRDKQADLLMLGRALVADAAWASKASEGRQNQVRKCVSCNTCWQVGTMLGSAIRCDNNPLVGAADEADWQPAKASQRKRVIVVGGGVAGMEAAWIAAGRGHEVTVFGASAETGGKTRLHAALPGGGGLSYVFDYQRQSADRFGVRLKLNNRASFDDVLALRPDVVILATGSTMSRPEFLPAEQKGKERFHDLRALMATMLAQSQTRQKGTAVIYDQDHTAMTYAAAEYLNDRFYRVVLVTPRGGIAADEALVTRQAIYKRLYAKKIEIVIFSKPLSASPFSDGTVICGNVYDGSKRIIDDVALFTYSTSRKPNDELSTPLRAKGIEFHLIGDCYAPRMVLTATSDGHRVGTSI